MFEYVEKHRVAARVCLPGEDPIDGEFCLAPLSQFHAGPETLLELLNSPIRVIPFCVPERGSVLLLTRLNVDWAMTADDVDPGLVCPPTYAVTREEVAHVTFNDGRTLTGLIQMEMPEGMNRVSDFLNEPGEFFPIRARMGIVIVNKARVREVRVTEVSPRPIGIGGASRSA